MVPRDPGRGADGEQSGKDVSPQRHTSNNGVSVKVALDADT